MNSSVLCGLIAFYCLLLPAAAHSEGDYQVEGLAQYKVLAGSKTQTQTRVVFRCSVHGLTWTIRTSAEDGSGFDYQEVGFDGAELYWVSSMKRLVEKAKLKQGASEVPDNIATAMVLPGKVFRKQLASEIGPIWLAYASSDYFEKFVSGAEIEPVVPIDGSGFSYEHPAKTLQKATWTRLDEFPHLPLNVVYQDDGFWRGYSLAASNPRRPPPFDKGFTNAVYSVTELTNIGGVVVPASSVLTLYVPKGDGLSNKDLDTHSMYDIKLTSFRLGVHSETLRPVIPGNTYVTDLRFISDVGAVGYSVTDDWLGASDVQELPGFQRRVDLVTAERKNANIVKVVVAVVMVILPALWFIKTTIRKKGRLA